MGHIFRAHFAILGPTGGQIIQKYRKIIQFNYKSIFIYVIGKILCKKNINTLNYVLFIIFSEFVILFPHNLTLSPKHSHTNGVQFINVLITLRPFLLMFITKRSLRRLTNKLPEIKTTISQLSSSKHTY
jgi:hypothetical protein